MKIKIGKEDPKLYFS